jgi:PAS domain S-box-containing protein
MLRVKQTGSIPPDPSVDLLQEPTAQGARRIFIRFVLVAVGFNALIGLAVVGYHVYDSISDTHYRLEQTGDIYLSQARRLRAATPRVSDVELMRRASRLLDVPMALVDRKDKEVRATSHPGMHAALDVVYGGKLRRGMTVCIKRDLGVLSGGWVMGRFTADYDLIVVVTRTEEEEGLAMYMTIAAGIAGVAVGLSFLIMLTAANWMLHRPLTRLVNQLTGALARDVERRKQAEEHAVAARQEAERHLAFMNSLIDASEAVGIVAVDPEDRVQIFNWGAARILGYSADEVVGSMSLEQLRGRSAAGDGRSPLLHAGEDEERWVNRDGEDLLLYVNESAIRRADGEVEGKLVTFIDVTERRKLEAELQLQELQLIQSAKLATLGEMATGIAHEVNQPLNNIGLLSSRIRRRLDLHPLDSEERSFYTDKLEKIQSQVERAGKIIDHLRAFGRPTDTRLTSVSVRAPVDGVMVFLREQLTRRGIEVTVDLPASLPRVHADEARLEQVLMNLIVNARDALDQMDDDSARKHISITAQEGSLPTGEPALGIVIRDNGPGMPSEVVDRIFEPFFTTKEVGKGTGLGLSISYGLVRGFGGVLEVESAPGEGTTFTIQLRRA